jgi:hypothetical protein
LRFTVVALIASSSFGVGGAAAQVDVSLIPRDAGAAAEAAAVASRMALVRARAALLEAREAVDDALFEVDHALAALALEASGVAQAGGGRIPVAARPAPERKQAAGGAREAVTASTWRTSAAAALRAAESTCVETFTILAGRLAALAELDARRMLAAPPRQEGHGPAGVAAASGGTASPVEASSRTGNVEIKKALGGEREPPLCPQEKKLTLEEASAAARPDEGLYGPELPRDEPASPSRRARAAAPEPTAGGDPEGAAGTPEGD